MGHIGSDASVIGVGGNLRTGSIGADAQFKGLHGNADLNNVGADLLLQADFPAGSTTRLRVGGSARVLLPDNANLSVRASVGGVVNGRSIVSHAPGNRVTLVYGDGAAQLDVTAGGNLELHGNVSPRSSSSGGSGSWHWSEFGREWHESGA